MPCLVVVLIVLTGCVGVAPVHPALMNNPREMPVDANRRDAVLDAAQSEPTPEQHQRLTPRMRKVETAAATAAAWIGILMSKTSNVLPGAGGSFDENELAGQRRQPAREQPKDATHEAAEPAAPATELVPWIHLN